VTTARSRRAAFGQLTPRQSLVGLFVFAFVVRTIYLLEISRSPFFRTLVGDAAFYDAWAVDIRHDWLGKEIFYQAPLYPYFLASIYSVAGHDTLAVRLVQIVFGAGACVLLAVGGRSFVSGRAAWIAGLLLALYAPALFFDGLVQKPSLDLFFVTALIFLLGRIQDASGARGTAFAAGVVLGCLSLTRENALVLIPAMGAWLVWIARPGNSPRGAGRSGVTTGGRSALRLVGPLLLGSGVILASVALRNYRVGHELVLTTSQFGANFYVGNNEAADGLYEPLVWGHGSYPEEHRDAIELAEQAIGRHLSPREVSSYWSGLAWRWIREHPLDWLRLMGKKWLLVWNAKEIPDSDEPLVYRDASWLMRGLGSLFVFGVVCPLAAAGVVAQRRRWRRLVALYLIGAGIACSASLFVVFARYRFPMVPVLLLFAGAALDDLLQRLRNKERRPLVVHGAVLVATSAMVWLPLPVGTDESPRATAYYNLAVSLEAQGATVPAMTSYRAAIANQPDFAQAHANLGALLAGSGQLDAAITEERSALAVVPGDPIAHTNLANALLVIGHLDEAELHYRAALSAEPDLASAREGLFAVGMARRDVGK
jgi:4-amino-4-deoxy-L-arabinose transferase-like glycosyltransferase